MHARRSAHADPNANTCNADTNTRNTDGNARNPNTNTTDANAHTTDADSNSRNANSYPANTNSDTDPNTDANANAYFDSGLPDHLLQPGGHHGASGRAWRDARSCYALSFEHNNLQSRWSGRAGHGPAEKFNQHLP